MRISFPSHHTWYKFIAEDPILQFGQNSRRKLRASLPLLPSWSVAVIEEPVEQALDWFLPMHKMRVAEKEHPLSVDIRQTISGSRRFPYKALCLYENGEPLGAMLYTIRSNKLSIGYRTFAHQWNKAELKASPSLLMEYSICIQAQALGKRALTHGKDRNPYGINSDIGLCAFKLSAGCKARLSKKHAVEMLDTNAVNEDMLVLGFPDSGKRITKAYLLTSKEALESYAQLFAYPELLSVEAILRD